MQYVEYQYAKDHKMIGDVLYHWLQTVRHLGIRTKGEVIKDWREEKVLLNIGDKGPGFANQKTIDDWTKAQINPDFHGKAYQSAYLKGYFKL